MLQGPITFKSSIVSNIVPYILLTKIATAESEGALIYHRVRGLCFLAVIFAATIVEYIKVCYVPVNNVTFFRKKIYPSISPSTVRSFPRLK